ncbi:thioredoxin family protein [Chitinophaga costaii]|nr:thioredoxin family protein [Chitinophaga costaii]
MNFQWYVDYYDKLLHEPNPPAPYDQPKYIEFTRLNLAHMNRWMRSGILLPETQALTEKITAPQHWTVITEAWCADAANTIPFIRKIAALREQIKVTYELRDSAPFRINNYLTGTSKSIPKLIIQDKAGQDIFVWGPRPAECQALYNQLQQEKAPFETMKVEMQKWYNHDAGRSFQQELIAGLVPLLV